MTAVPVPEACWGGFRLTPVTKGRLVARSDGALEIDAEAKYLLEFDAENATPPAWQAVSGLRPGLVILHFLNFIGETELAGKRLIVSSTRLKADELKSMLENVVSRLESLPFGFSTPTAFAYERDSRADQDVVYQRFIFVRHALAGLGRHDVPRAMERVLARPYVRLKLERADVPLGHARRVDSTTLLGLASQAGVLVPVSADSPLAQSPVALALGGKLPESVTAQRAIETTATPENRFVAGLLALLEDVIRETRRAVVGRGDVGADEVTRDAAAMERAISRWRQHPVLRNLDPARNVSLNSAVLRNRPGYRELTRFYVDLVSRTRFLHGAALQMLDARDAATLYEYWCFFEVADAVGRVLQEEPAQAHFEYGELTAGLPRSYAASFGDVVVRFNKTYSPPSSYSVSLRPDISVDVANGDIHLLDAKFKRDVLPVITEEVADQEEQRATYRRGDLYKMHTYRDAIGARSVWILYPGRDVQPAEFRSKPDADAGLPPDGVGAIPLLPGVDAHRAGLDAVVSRMIGVTMSSDSASC